MALSDAQERRPTLLLTRPQPQSSRFAAQARERFGADWPIVTSPLMQVQFLDPPKDIGRFAAVIFTSENGVAACGNGLGGHCHCVGQRTADAARAAGWDVGLTAPDAEALAAALIARHSPGPLLHPHGLHVAGSLVQRLNQAGTDTVSQVVYDQQALPPTPESVALLARETPVLVPLFSPRSAQLFQRVAAAARAPLWVAALSPAVADALTLPLSRQVVADQPDSAAMLEALARLMRPID